MKIEVCQLPPCADLMVTSSSCRDTTQSCISVLFQPRHNVFTGLRIRRTHNHPTSTQLQGGVREGVMRSFHLNLKDVSNSERQSNFDKKILNLAMSYMVKCRWQRLSCRREKHNQHVVKRIARRRRVSMAADIACTATLHDSDKFCAGSGGNRRFSFLARLEPSTKCVDNQGKTSRAKSNLGPHSGREKMNKNVFSNTKRRASRNRLKGS